MTGTLAKLIKQAESERKKQEAVSQDANDQAKRLEGKIIAYRKVAEMLDDGQSQNTEQ